VRRVEIPKPDARTRALGIPTIRDRVVQAALKIVLEPILEADFHPDSFGFRPKRSAHQALNTIIDEAWAGGGWWVEADVASFFDEVDHDILMAALAELDRKLLKAIRALLGAGSSSVATAVIGHRHTAGRRHLASARQRLPHRLDREWERRHRGLGRLIRYADDLVIVCRYESQAERALVVLQEELSRLGLRIQPAKTGIVNLKHGEGFDFLGFQPPLGRRRPASRRVVLGAMAVQACHGPRPRPDTRAHRTQTAVPTHRGDRRLHQPVPSGSAASSTSGSASCSTPEDPTGTSSPPSHPAELRRAHLPRPVPGVETRRSATLVLRRYGS
jgi:RNA-directed DNA polymerase